MRINIRIRAKIRASFLEGLSRAVRNGIESFPIETESDQSPCRDRQPDCRTLLFLRVCFHRFW